MKKVVVDLSAANFFARARLRLLKHACIDPETFCEVTKFILVTTQKFTRINFLRKSFWAKRENFVEVWESLSTSWQILEDRQKGGYKNLKIFEKVEKVSKNYSTGIWHFWKVVKSWQEGALFVKKWHSRGLGLKPRFGPLFWQKRGSKKLWFFCFFSAIYGQENVHFEHRRQGETPCFGDKKCYLCFSDMQCPKSDITWLRAKWPLFALLFFKKDSKKMFPYTFSSLQYPPPTGHTPPIKIRYPGYCLDTLE